MRSRAELRRSDWRKKLASRVRDAHRREDDHEVVARTLRHRRLLCDLRGELRSGRPKPEKIGSFWPRTSVLRPSIAETPVSMNSVG